MTLSNDADAVIYEVHIRDFSISRSSGILNRGKYLGMVETGTKTPEGEKSGLNHLEELGITHVHLLPVNDYAGGNERQKVDEYTWYSRDVTLSAPSVHAKLFTSRAGVWTGTEVCVIGSKFWVRDGNA